jgi:threonine/homoserine/homoserine lactone efflux protein
MTVGSAIITEGLKTSLIAAGFFIAGHWVADGVWYLLISGSFSRGKGLMSDRVYNTIVTACGVFLVLFGLWFMLYQFI